MCWLHHLEGDSPIAMPSHFSTTLQTNFIAGRMKQINLTLGNPEIQKVLLKDRLGNGKIVHKASCLYYQSVRY